jgi:hypothetical protein
MKPFAERIGWLLVCVALGWMLVVIAVLGTAARIFRRFGELEQGAVRF